MSFEFKSTSQFLDLTQTPGFLFETSEEFEIKLSTVFLSGEFVLVPIFMSASS